MGLAPYGRPRNDYEIALAEKLRAIFRSALMVNDEGTFAVDPTWYYYGTFSSGRQRVTDAMMRRLSHLIKWTGKHGSTIDPDLECDRPVAVLAFVLQEVIEECILRLVGYYLRSDRRTCAAKSVALAGGVAHNIGANARLVSSGLISANRLFVQPAAGDAGTSIGAAQIVANYRYGQEPRRKMRRADLGLAYSDADIEACLQRRGLRVGGDYRVFQDEDELARAVATCIAKNQVVGWFQGRSEFGPRALGYRSILLNATWSGANTLANQIKRRQSWRPSAISISYDAAGTFLDTIGDAHAPFMNVAFSMSNAGARVTSGRHPADGTTRPQTVAKDVNARLWRVLEHLRSMTGVPVVVNTSFNRREPLVETPDEALNTFFYMKGMDVLCIGRTLVTGRKHLSPSVRSLEDESATRSRLCTAQNSSRITDYDNVFGHLSRLSGNSTTMLRVIIRNRSNAECVYTLPLAKEMLNDREHRNLQLALASNIYNRAILHGAEGIYIGTDGPYSLVIYDKLAALLRSAFPSLAAFANYGAPVEILPLREHRPSRSRADCLVVDSGDCSTSGCSIGIDIGFTMTKGGIVNDGKLVWSYARPTPKDRGLKGLLHHIRCIVLRACNELWHTAHLEGLGGIGITLPSVVQVLANGSPHVGPLLAFGNALTRRARDRRNVAMAIENFRLNLADEVDCNVWLLNDVDAFGVAEISDMRGLGRACHGNSLVVALGTGVGDALIENGRIDFNRPHQASQAVISLGKSDGQHSKGVFCLAEYLNRARWESLAKEHSVGNVEKALARRSGSESARATLIVQEQATHLVEWSRHLSGLTPIDQIIVTGGAANGLMGQQLVQDANLIAAQRARSEDRAPVVFYRSRITPSHGGAIGAAHFASLVSRVSLLSS
jgi:predicted NodU family carbamoyl transferase/predicted NBD/HSP70 family sugar kinase